MLDFNSTVYGASIGYSTIGLQSRVVTFKRAVGQI